MSKRALIVDDAEPNRILIGAIISKLGVSVEYAEDGDEAVQKFITFEPHIVIIDQIMPRKNGSESIREMKHIANFDFVAVLMSALTNSEDIKEILESCGANEFLPKPISSSIITDLLQRHRIIDGSSA